MTNAAVKHRRMYHPTKSISEPSGNDKLPDVQSGMANAAQHRAYSPIIEPRNILKNNVFAWLSNFYYRLIESKLRFAKKTSVP